MSNRAAFLESEKGSFAVRDAPIEQPGDGEVLVKVFAAAIQPADTKVAKSTLMTVEYPAILGSPVAGVVEALGKGVSKVAVGERVICGTKIFSHKKAKYGGLQKFCVVDESEIVEIGDTPFTKAVTLASYTPPGALFGPSYFNMHRPTIPPFPLSAEEHGKKMLIWGGSSAMGTLTISYAKAAGYTVISTSSPHNFGLLRSVGADHVFDHSDPNTVQAIRDLFPIHYWFDTISLAPTITTILKIAAPDGKVDSGKDVDLLLLLPPMMIEGMPGLPEGVSARFFRFSTHAEENKEWVEWLLARGGFLERGIKEDVIRGVPPTVLGGLEKVSEGIDMVHKGVSGTKVVIEPWV